MSSFVVTVNPDIGPSSIARKREDQLDIANLSNSNNDLIPVVGSNNRVRSAKSDERDSRNQNMT